MALTPRIILGISALLFFGFGAAFFVEPTEMAATVELHADSAISRTEIRAMYGGLEIGFAIFLAWCALDSARLPIGLVASGLALLGIGTGRLAGIALAGAGNRLLWTLVVAELLGAAISFVGLWLVRE